MEELEHNNSEINTANLLLEDIFHKTGSDFRNYEYNLVLRRLARITQLENLITVDQLRQQIQHDSACIDRIISGFSIHITEMFRDPSFFLSFRTHVVPVLRTYPCIRIWHAGCSTGEEALSMAILLHEEGIYDKTHIYATDMNEDLLREARSNSFSVGKMQTYTKNYVKSGGCESFSKYYSVKDGKVSFQPYLFNNIIFAQHNLAVDRSLKQFHVILCRNVMIYFNKSLQDQVHDLLYGSLELLGFIALGSKESIRFSKHALNYAEYGGKEKLYRKMK